MNWIRSWGALFLCLGLLLLFIARPLGVNAPDTLKTDFNTERALGRLKTILGDERPHPTDSDANDAVLDRLLAQIRQLGFTPEIRDRFHCNDIRKGAAICARPRNVVFWVTAPGDDAVMLTAHYDSVAAGPGAADDGMGVAIALEVAQLLKGKSLGRPVLILITDSEEAGLVGAAAFAAHDPLVKRIGAVVNLEARGTTGTANMFQTSTPNGHDIAALAAGGVVASTSAIATDFYKLLPNDTDLTMFLPLDIDAANFAIQSAGKRYHTPLDNLAHLDPRSVRQMGAGALSAINGFASAPGKGEERQRIFTDLDHRALLILPNPVALAVLLFGLAAAVTLFVRSSGRAPVRTALAPVIAVVAGTGFAVLMGMLLAAVRPETAFGTAYPIAARALYGAMALLGAALTLFLLRVEGGVRLTAAAWAWLTLLVLAAFAFVPGLSILAVWPLLLVTAATAATFFPATRPAVPWLLAAAALFFALIALPLAAGLEEGLFIEKAAPATFLLVFLFLFAMPVNGRRFRVVPLTLAVLSLAALAAALTVPAYTRDAPRHLSIVHEDDDGKASFIVQDRAPVPDDMRALASFTKMPDAPGYWRAPAPRIADDGTLEIGVVTRADGTRSYTLSARSPQADRQEFMVKQGDGVRNLVVNGAVPVIKGPLVYAGCSGRSCKTLDVRFDLLPKAPLPKISWRRTRFGAGPDAQALVAARPDTAQPVHTGDQQSIIRAVKLPAGPPPPGN